MANIISITALNRYVKSILESDPVLTDIALRGEISNFVHHFKTGHFYFSLKDEACSVKAVMFRGDASQLAFMPKNGMRVIVHCRISLFERDGSFQVYAEDMFPDGVGAMQLAFEQLKDRLEKEGLFAQEHKRPLPAMPRCVGLVTSKTGAALQDIFNVARRRNPAAHFLLASVTVQGNEAASGIAAAIRTLSQSGKADVIIVARGGGSKEDLWVFNSEAVARAAYASKVPVVSAIGHEIDFCILDFTADLRAPTPSAAAELVMPDLSLLMQNAENIFGNIRKTMQNKIDLWYTDIIAYSNAPALVRASLLPGALYDGLTARREQTSAAVQARLAQAQRALAHSTKLCATLNPYAVLARGYAMVQKGGTVVRNSSGVAVGDAVNVTLAQGALCCIVKDTLA